MTRVLGVDPSLAATGLCVTDGAAPWLVVSRTKVQSGTAGKLGRMLDQVEVVRRHAATADLAVLESPSFGSRGSATRDLAGLWWLLVHRLRADDVPLGVCPPAVLKKWTTGTGNADKFRVGQAIAKRWPDVELRSPDEADALALASIGLHRLGRLPWAPTAVQAAQLARVEWLEPACARLSPPTRTLLEVPHAR